jgi:hypothetical protein
VDLPIILLLAALAAWAIWTAYRGQPIFEIRVKNGVPRITRGTATASFLGDVGDACRRHQVRSGVIRGESKGRQIALSFSSNIPPFCQQQLRNVWNVSGWSTGPRPRRR